MERIQKYLNRIYRAAVLDRTAAFAARGLPGWQVSYILQICRTPGLRQDELAARLLVNKSSVTRQVAQMQQNGLVLRETDPSDRRIKRLHPTEKAQALYPEIMSYLEEWNDALTGDLSPQDQADLLRLLNHLAKAATLRLRSQDLDTLLNDDLPTDQPTTTAKTNSHN